MQKIKKLYDLSKLTFIRWDISLKHLQNSIQFVMEFCNEMYRNILQKKTQKKKISKTSNK